MGDHKNNISALSLEHMHCEIREEVLEATARVYDNGQFVLGPEVDAFEKEYAEYIETQHCITCATGFDALELAMRVLGIGPGDGVLVPTNTCAPTWLAISAAGAIPVPVEPDPITFNVTVESLQATLIAHTSTPGAPEVKAIIPVHLYGQACPMPEIMKWAEQENLLVIEDNAQGHGARINGQRTGSFGQVNAHSFYPSKNLGALGEGGAMTTNDNQLAEQLRWLRNYGSHKKNYNKVRGVNARFDELQAAYVRIKLKHLGKWNAQRRALARVYFERLGDVKGLLLPQPWLDERQVFHIFPVFTSARAALKQYLHDHNIGTLIHYPVPPHLQEAYSDLGYREGAFPIAERLAREELSLPLYPGLSEDVLHRICDVVLGFLDANS